MANQEAHSPIPTPCPQCGGARGLAEAAATVRLVRPGTILQGRHSSALWAVVCVTCGYTDFYAKEPAEVVEQQQ